MGSLGTDMNSCGWAPRYSYRVVVPALKAPTMKTAGRFTPSSVQLPGSDPSLRLVAAARPRGRDRSGGPGVRSRAGTLRAAGGAAADPSARAAWPRCSYRADASGATGPAGSGEGRAPAAAAAWARRSAAGRAANERG